MKQQLSGPSDIRETAPRCEYQTIEICLRRLLSQKRLCSMSMNQGTLISKTQKPWWNANGMPLTRIPKLTLLLHNTEGSAIWIAYSLEDVFLASLFKAAVVLHFRLTCSWCLYASKKMLAMAWYRMPVDLTRDGNERGIWNSRKNPFSKVHKSSCLSIRP